jgi:hypothetical protein
MSRIKQSGSVQGIDNMLLKAGLHGKTMSATYRSPLTLELDTGQCPRAERQVHKNSRDPIQLLSF